MNWLAALAGLAAGAAAGFGIRFANPWLAAREGLEPGRPSWMRWAPPVAGAIALAATGARVGWTPLLAIDWLWMVLLVQVVFFDLEHRLILDRLLFPAMAAALALSLLTPHLGWKLSLLTGLVAGGVFLVIAVAGSLVLRAEVLGFGDVKLAAFIGLILGPVLTLDALLFGVMAAGVTSIALLVLRLKVMQDTIAYGPYLCLGAMVMLVTRGAGVNA